MATKFYKKVPINQSSVIDPDQLTDSLQDGMLQKPPESFFGGILPSPSWMLGKMFCDGQREGYKPRCILKTRLNQEIDAVKKLTEERDLSDDRPISCSDQLSDENRIQFKNVSAGQKTKKPKPQDPPQHFNQWNCFEPLRHEDSVKDSTCSSNADKSFTTVLLDNSMIKQMQTLRLGGKVSHHVVLKYCKLAKTHWWAESFAFW